jgi:signal transduction histidine kinase/ligand-binding sensor domain-containing protein
VVRLSELPSKQLLIETANGSFFELLNTQVINDSLIYHFEALADHFPNLKKVLDSTKNVQTHFTTKDGSIWIYTFDHVIRIQLDSNTQKATYTQHPIRAKKYLSYLESSQLTSFVENLSYDTEGIYAIKDANTLLKFNWEKNAFEAFLHLPPKLHLKGRPVLDKQNNLWVFQSKGNIAKINLKTFSTSLDTSSNTKLRKIIAEQWYFNAEQDKNGSLWLGTPGLGVVKLKDFSRHFSEVAKSPYFFKKDFRYRTNSSSALFSKSYQRYLYQLRLDSILNQANLSRTSKTFQHIAIGQDSTVWIPAESKRSEQGYLLGLKSGKAPIQVPLRLTTSKFGLLPWVMHLDRENQVWFYSQAQDEVGTFNVFNPKTNQLKEFEIPTKIRSHEYPFVSDLTQDQEGVFWLASMDGLFSFLPLTKEWKHYELSPSQEKTLSNQRIFSILPSPIHSDNIIWLGTDGNGLLKFNKKSQKTEQFTQKEGLPNNVIYGILPDYKNNLWLSTNQGLCLFNPSTYQTRDFSLEDGLPLMEFNRYAYCKDEQGMLYFEGQGKIIKVNPPEFYRDRKASKVLINRFKILNQEIDYNQESTLAPQLKFRLDSPISQSKKITLPHQAIMFSLGFSMLDLSSPNENKYQYRLSGFNEEWLDAGVEQEATFTNLNPGNYIFEVRGLNSYDVWSEPTLLQIEMLAPWYQTIWFSLLLLITLSSLLYLLYKYRVNELLRVERMRNEIAQDLHDEMGSTLSSISLYSAVMQKHIKNLSPKADQMLAKIIENTSSMMSSMNDMVWSIKADNDNFESVTNRLRAFAVSLAESQNMKLSFEVNSDAEKLELGMQERKNIYLIFKEAINNAAKYSEASKIRVVIQLKQKVLLVSAQDNGIGLEASARNQEQLSLSGNGIAGMQARAKQIKADFFIQSSKGKGCIVELKLMV